MDNIEIKIRNMADSSLPSGLHHKIMRCLFTPNIAKLKNRLIAIAILSTANSIFLLWRVLIRLVEYENFNLFKMLISEFQWERVFIFDFLVNIKEFFPVYLMAIAITSLAVAFYVIYTIFNLEKDLKYNFN